MGQSLQAQFAQKAISAVLGLQKRPVMYKNYRGPAHVAESDFRYGLSLFREKAQIRFWFVLIVRSERAKIREQQHDN